MLVLQINQQMHFSTQNLTVYPLVILLPSTSPNSNMNSSPLFIKLLTRYQAHFPSLATATWMIVDCSLSYRQDIKHSEGQSPLGIFFHSSTTLPSLHYLLSPTNQQRKLWNCTRIPLNSFQFLSTPWSHMPRQPQAGFLTEVWRTI
jgi:hypothetical protein